MDGARDSGHLAGSAAQLHEQPVVSGHTRSLTLLSVGKAPRGRRQVGRRDAEPYYIAIFASLYRLYRSLAPDGRARCGLVLLDEAFSKMDEARIEATLRFARALGLQLVMATPKERSKLVAPWVETSLYVHRDPVSGMPSVLDFSKELKPDADVGDCGAPGPAQPAA